MYQKIKSVRHYIISLLIFSFCSGISCYSQNQILIQAETADTIKTGSIDHDDQGYTGAGFINLDNVMGTYVVWMISLPVSNKYTITVRFANGSTNRTMNIFVNNILVIENLNFLSTGSWTTWDTISFQVDFIGGMNNLKFVGSNPNSGPSLDCLTIGNPEVNLEVPPTAVNDTYNCSNKAIAFIDPLSNDYDSNGDELHIVSWTNPSHGVLDTVQGGDKFYYKAGQAYLGTDSFSYIITDGMSEASATVIVNLND